jgi:hypothetical protein
MFQKYPNIEPYRESYILILKIKQKNESQLSPHLDKRLKIDRISRNVFFF